MNRRILRAVLAMTGSLAALVLMAAPAAAHARVISTTPGNGSTIDGKLARITIVFDDPVRLVPRSLVVSGASGAPEPTGAPRVVGGKSLEATLSGRLPAGRYFVGWRILSDDGHVESGSFGFAVAAAGAAPSSASAAMGSAPPAPAQPTWPVVVAAAMAGVALLGAVVVVVRGLAAVRAAAIPPYPVDRIDAASRREHAPMHH